MMFCATVCDTYPYNTESYNTERASGFMSLCEAMKPDTVVPLLTARPKLLFFTDLRPWPSDWRNQSYAKYHGVETVRALPSQLILQDDTTPDVRQKTLDSIKAAMPSVWRSSRPCWTSSVVTPEGAQ